MPKITKDRIIFDAEDFVGGFAPTTVTSFDNKNIRKFGGYTFASDFDPFDTIPGIAYPGKTSAKLTNVDSNSPNELLVDATTDYGLSNAFAIGTTLLERFTITSAGSSDILTVSGGVFPHTITPHGHSSLDATKGAVRMYNQLGNNLLFYSWNDGTDWDVGVYRPSNDTFVDAFMSGGTGTGVTAVTNPLAGSDLTDGQGKHHPLHVSDQDDILYIGSGRHVHSYEGSGDSANTFFAQDFVLPLNFDVKSMADTQFDLVVFADSSANTGRAARARAFFWDASRPADAYKIVDLEDYQVISSFSFGGTVGCHTSNREGLNTLRLYNSSTGVFDRVFEYGGALPVNGGTDIVSQTIKWNSGGKVFQWGNFKGIFGFNSGHQVSTHGNTSGFLKVLTSGVTYLSGGSGNDGLAILENFDEDARWTSAAAYPTFDWETRGKIRAVKVTIAKAMSSGRQVTINLFTGGSTIGIGTITTSTTSTMTRVFTKDSSGNELPNFEYVIADLSWGGSTATDAIGIEKVEVFFEETTVNVIET